jgi:integrase
MRGNPHVRFGGRAEETDQSKHRHRASARSNHWSATEAIGRGLDIRTVAGRLAHANAAMTLRTYAHAMDGADAGVAATLAAALAGET